MQIPVSHPLYLYLDSKKDCYPNPTAALRSRTRRSTTFSFQVVGCDYFVDVRFLHGEGPEAVNHEVTITITDFVNEAEAGQPLRVKQTNFLPIRDRQPSRKDARYFANIHLIGHTDAIV